MSYKNIYKEWLKDPFDNETIKATRELAKNENELEDSFYKDLEFGTGGMRGLMGVGTNRINKYTLGKNTQGISNYLVNNFKKNISTIYKKTKHFRSVRCLIYSKGARLKDI